MKKVLVCCLLFIFCCIHSVSARPVSEEEAKRVALNWVLEKWGRPLEMSTLETSSLAKVESNNLYYVLSFLQGGWIIVSADDVAYPIIAFSYTGSYSAQEHPIQFDEWMNNVQKEISDAIIQYSLPLPEADITWQRFNVSADEFSARPLSAYAVNPLLTTRWNQGIYYNSSCPVDANGSGGHVWAGCVATAMAQVMKYHNHPETGSGSHSYVDDRYGTQSANFGATTYNWASMPSSLSGNNSAVATLLYHAGVSVEMDYGVADGSGANTSYDTVNALKKHFKYSNALYFAWRSSYSTGAWKALLQTELNNNRPILYRGSGSGGHAFVCDGYFGSDFYHFNWGWGGYYDGYFYLSDLTPGSHNYNYDQGAIFDIEPKPARPNIIGPISLLLLGGEKDDAYEENDTLATAWYRPNWEQQWLSNISGLGIQADDDWYRIFVTSGYHLVSINLQFTHTDGDIDLELLNASGRHLAGSYSVTDNESINHVVPAGDTWYYLRVYYANEGNTYDLWWDDLLTP